MTVLTPDGLYNIKTHKYKGGSYSPLDNIMNNWWLWTAGFVPKTVAPNTVTTLGLLISLSAYALNAYFAPRFVEAIPTWVSLYTAFSVFAYQTLDAIDGKHARATKSSSPLGQLFDHGCDAFNTIIITLPVLASSHLGAGVMGVLVFGIILSTFVTAQWNEYWTGVLQTHVCGFGVTESQLSAIFIHLVPVFAPARFWTTPVAQSGWLAEQIGAALQAVGLSSLTTTEALAPELQPRYLLGSVYIVLLGFSNLSVVISTFRSVPARKRLCCARTLLPANSLLVVGTLLWINARPSMGSVFYAAPHIMMFTLGLAAVHYATRVIVWSMAHQKLLLRRQHGVYVCWLLVAGDYLDIGGVATACFVLGLVVLSYLRFIQSAIEEVAQALGIYCFTLGPRLPEQGSTHSEAVLATMSTADRIRMRQAALTGRRSSLHG